MKQIKAAVVGYGNIGRYVVEALQAAPDFEIAGIVRRGAAEPQPVELAKYRVVDNIAALTEEGSGLEGGATRAKGVDVAIICSPSRRVEQTASGILAAGVNTVDSFDIHSEIVGLRERLQKIALTADAVAIVAAGWDPGSDSVVRALVEACAPVGVTYTDFGPGMSMGHSVAARAVKGVAGAISMTIPTGTGIHRRMVYVELENGAGLAQVAAAIKADPYFAHDETHVIETQSVAAMRDMGHGVHLTRKGVSGRTHNQRFEFTMSINNPALTAQILVSAARASMLQRAGAYTLIEIPPIDLLAGEREDLIRRLV